MNIKVKKILKMVMKMVQKTLINQVYKTIMVTKKNIIKSIKMKNM